MDRQDKKPTNKQQWQRERYMSKGAVAGMIGLINGLGMRSCMTPAERERLGKARRYLNMCLRYWEVQAGASEQVYMFDLRHKTGTAYERSRHAR